MMHLSTRLLLAIALILPLSWANEIFTSSWLYDWGWNGLHPQTWYRSFDLGAPLLNFLQWDQRCDDGYYLFSPRGSIVWKPGPVIMDGRGNLVWASDGYGEVTDLKVQRYGGNAYLTFWGGKVADRRGRGVYYMLDSSYQVFRTVEPVGEDLGGDLHEFRITEEGTALMTVYQYVSADLSSLGGPAEGWVQDSMFQEVDIETGELIFEWKASEHVDVQDTMRVYAGSDLGETPQAGFDYFHINSVDKDGDGNYIISGRHAHTIMCISPQGRTLWVLGGKKNMFKDVSDGEATNFAWQHHARMHDNNTISFFDNQKSETTGDRYMGDHSRGMLVQLDTQAMTAKLLQVFANPEDPQLAQSQGSVQMLPDTGNVVVSYGFLPTFTEFAPDGSVLCDVRIAPWIVFPVGMVTSYRTFKTTRWVGQPEYPPSVFLRPSEGRMYVSWNGATEVDGWVLQGADWAGVRDGNFTDIWTRAKDGEFEASFVIREDMPLYLRVMAVDKHGRELKVSPVVNRKLGNAPSTALTDVLTGVGIVVGVLVVLLLLFRKRIHRVIKSCQARSVLDEKKSGGIWAFVRRWRDWRRANAHELQRLYDED